MKPNLGRALIESRLRTSQIHAGSFRYLFFLLLLVLSFSSSFAAGKRILMLRVTFADEPTEPISYYAGQSMVDASVEPFFRNMSFGTESFDMTVSVESFALPKTKDEYFQNYTAILADAKVAAAASYNLGEYTDIGVVFPKLPFDWAGKGGFGKPGSIYINGTKNFHPFVISHEVGHTYGLGHANLWQSSDLSPIGSGTSVEYGDRFDVMGMGPEGYGHFNPRWKFQLGWLKEVNILQPTASGTYRLYCFDNPGASPTSKMTIKIPRSDGRVYWIGLRGQYLGVPGYTKGLYFTLDAQTLANKSNMLDMVPQGGNPYDAPLAENATFSDSEEGFQITTGKIQGAGLSSYVDVAINITRPPRTIELWGQSAWKQNIPPPNSEDIIDVAIAYQQSLGLRSDGTVVQWGEPYLNIPPPAGLNDVVRVAASGIFCLALKADGRVVHWGWAPSITQSLAKETNVVEIVAGGYHCLVLHADGTVAVHGDNAVGQRSNMPAGLKDVVAMAAGEYHSLVLRKDGTVVAWGRNLWGESTVPAGLTGVVGIACQQNSNMALKSDGTVVKWGYYSDVPPWLGKVRRMVAGGYWTLVQLETGEMAAWGEHEAGQTTIPYVEPSKIRGFAAGGDNGAILVGNVDEDRFHVWRVKHRISVNEPLKGDSDADGQTLLEEYAFGRNPKIADRINPLAMTTTPEGGLTFSYKLSSRAVDVKAQLEVSSDLVNWTPVNSEDAGTEGDFRLYRYQAGVAPAKLFGRLRLTAN